MSLKFLLQYAYADWVSDPSSRHLDLFSRLLNHLVGTQTPQSPPAGPKTSLAFKLQARWLSLRFFDSWTESHMDGNLYPFPLPNRAAALLLSGTNIKDAGQRNRGPHNGNGQLFFL